MCTRLANIGTNKGHAPGIIYNIRNIIAVRNFRQANLQQRSAVGVFLSIAIAGGIVTQRGDTSHQFGLAGAGFSHPFDGRRRVHVQHVGDRVEFDAMAFIRRADRLDHQRVQVEGAFALHAVFASSFAALGIDFFVLGRERPAIGALMV